MFKFNLLPPKEKKELSLNAINQWFVFFCGFLLVLVIIFTLLCLNSYLYLYIIIKSQNQLIEAEEKNAKAQELIQIEEKIKQTNQKIRKIDQLQASFICWTPILEEITVTVPSGIYLTSFLYQSGKDKASLSGHADTREKFIEFQDSLKESPVVIDLVSPLSNLTKKQDINFNFNFKINTSTPSCIKAE